MLVEGKRTGLVLPYRAAPILRPDVGALARALYAMFPDHVSLASKMSVEVRPQRIEKCEALAEFLMQERFRATRPMFFGHNENDLPALHDVQKVGDIAGYVGPTKPSLI